jgi:hypothetical protein
MTDHDAVSRLEHLIATQRPASVPWAPVTDYSVAARDQVERPHAELIVQHLLPAVDANVLDFGCGPDGHLVRNLRGAISRADLDASVVGYDPQIAYSNQYLTSEFYDLVICREVLEHLTIVELARTVHRLCALSSKLVYVTTRFNPAPSHLLDVMTSDDLDPTHITLLNQDFLRTLFVLEGFRRRSDLERLMDWRSYGRVTVYERA